MPSIDIGTTDVIRYVMIVDSTDGSPETGITITNLDLQYTRAGEAPVAKVDATALGATNSAHADNKMFEVDGTSSPGLYRVDWPDAAFIGGESGVLLVVTGTGFAPAVEDITLNVPVVQASGAAISQPPKASPNGFTITKGENEANTEDSAHALDGTTHDIEAQNDAGTEKIDVYYEFDIGGDGISTGCHIHAQLNKGGGAGKDLKIYAYDWLNTTWNQIGVLESDTSLATFDYSLFASHVGTGTDIGLVRIRFDTGSIALSATTKLLMDQILVEYTVVSRTVGYAQGAIWIDTGGSNTNTESYVDGTADNPVSTIGAAYTIAGNLNISDFHIVNGSSITLGATSSNYSFFGDNWTLALNGETMVGIHVEGAAVSGAMAGTGANQSFRNCELGAISIIAHTHFESCRITGTQTAIETGDIFYEDCHSGVVGNTAPIFDFGGALGSTDLHIRDYSGGIQFENMNDAGTDTATVEGIGQFIEGTCTAGAVTLRGMFTTSGITNITLTESGRLDIDQVAEASSRVFSGTSTGSSTAGKVYVQAADPPSGGADDDYNDALIIVWRGTTKRTARMNIGVVSDYDDSDPSFTLVSDLSFTPQANDLVEVWLADTATLAALNKLTTGFGSTVPDTLEGYLRAMMSKTASTPANAGTYNAATDSLEYLGERTALIEGSGFTTGTDSLKEIRDAIDTLIAPAVVGASSLSGSGFLSDCVTLVRRMTDEPSLLPKYTDADMVEHVTSAMTVVMSEIHNNSDHNIINRLDVQLVPGIQSYILPPNVGELWMVRKMSTVAPIIPIYEVWTDNHWSSHQSGFVIEHNEFRLLTDWRSTDVLQILYVPNGESLMHKATATSAAASTIIFPSSVTDGTLDTRANAYAGYLVRILSDTTGYVQERIINTYDNVTRTATVTTAWSPLPTGTIVYEVMPSYSNIIKHCVCQQAAMDVLGNEGNNKRLQTLTSRYLVKIRALRQMIGKKSSRFGGHALGDTSDNDTRGDYYGWLV
jgi:hypothetical protein